MRQIVSQVLLALSLLFMTRQVTAQCEDSYWPIYAGGAKGNEEVRCFIYDPNEQLIIVGGVTTSEDFAPAPNEHGYMFALDLSGNWKWGSFFYNVSYAVSSIDGCQLSSDGESLAVAGMGNSQPLLMDIKTSDGSFNKFISIDYIDQTAENVPSYTQYGAIYYDKRDYRDYQPYFYGAFIKDSEMFMLRVADGGPAPTIDWNFRFVNYSDTQELASPLLNMKEPNFIVPDPKQQSALYMIGRYRGKGSVIRFNKRDGSVRWHAQFEKMSSITSVSQALQQYDDDLFLCGYYQPNEGTTDSTTIDSTVNFQAVMARMKDNGDVSWVITASGKHPFYSANTLEDQDKCVGISYYKEKEQIAVVIQGKMTEVRGTNKGDWFDSILVLLNEGGQTSKVVVISQGTLQYDMYGGKNGVFWVGDDIFFAGHSYGFKTQKQVLQKDSDNLDSDAFIYKYRFGWGNDCLTLYEGSKTSMSNNMEAVYEDSEVKNKGLYTFTTTYRSIPMNKEDNYFIPYPSRYSGGFTLLDTMKIPRPCAYQSQNLTSVQYYRGQNTMQYDLYRQNSATVASYFTGTPYILFQDGSDANTLATFNAQQNTIDIQTDADEMVGIQKTIIRSCDNLDRLLEMNLYIEVISNTYPDFVSEPETAFTVAVNDVYQYQLPEVTDPEGNDEPEVYVGYMDQQEEKYPEFLLFNNDTNTISLQPDSKKYQGRTYYFTIVVKEKNSDSVKYSFYATVRVEGEVIDDNASTSYVIGENSEDGVTQVNYTIEYVDDKGRGSLKFTHPIYMQWLEENWENFFEIYWRDTTYRKTKQDLSLLDFKPTIFSEDGMTVNFTMKFSKPYRIGLLVKKSDRLHIDVKNDTDYTGLWITTQDQTWELGNTAAKIRLEMIFDFDNEVMSTFRSVAKNMYWVLIAIIIVQFIVLSIRGVGLLPVWVFIEYLQLVGFMPIYNFKLIPYLYDAFKPSLVAHMIIFDDTPFIEDLDKEYFNKNYENYWLSVGKLFQSFFFVCLFLAILILANIVVFALSKCTNGNSTLGAWAQKKMTQFKFNAYIRYYMLVYFDTTFFSVMKIMDPNNDTVARKAALLLSYVLLTVNIVLPVFLIAHINRRFDILAMKEAKQSFNSLLLKIDKASRWRIMNPAYFFARRLLTAMLLTLPIENTFIFLQYVFILMSSHAYILYMVAVKPYQTPGINSYVLASETFYSALIIAIFIFSDATPEMSIKFGAGVALIVSLILLVLSNLIMNVYYLWQGPAKIKKTIKEATLKRAEKEALERAEEEERKLKKKKEEEEFTKIPDETMNMSSIDASNTTQQNNTMSELNNPKKRGKGGKKKGMEDNVNEAGTVGGEDNFQPTKKRRRGKDKDKNKQDDVAEGTITGTGPSKSKKRQKKQTQDADPTTTVNQQTDFGTQNPTQKDLL